MKFTKKILSNGITAISVPMPSFESATALVMVGAGSRYETKKNNGISHFLEHMAFKGTKSRPSAMAITGIIDGIGGEFNAFTSKEYTGYYIKAAKNNIEVCVDILSDMIQNSLFDAVEIEKEKGVIIEEINLYEDTPMRAIGDVYERLIYGDTPMGWDTAGEKDIIRSITRKDFMNYMASLYSPSNITVVLAGGIDDAKTFKLVEKYFINMKRFKTVKPKKTIEKQSKPQVVIKHKKTEQVHIEIGFRTAPLNHPDRAALSVLAGILGGGFSSRLFTEVREKRGLAYYVRASSEQYTDAGYLAINAGVDPKRVYEAIEVIIAELRDLVEGRKPLSDEEFKRSKEYLKGHLVLELEDSRSASMYYSFQNVLEKKIENPDEAIEKINKVTEKDIMKVAKKYIVNSGLSMAIIGDFKNKERFEKLLRI